MRRAGEHLAGERSKRRDVHDVDASTVRSGDQIRFPRVNHHVPHRDRRETVAESDPVLASVDGDVRPVLGSDEQEVTVDSILSDDSDRHPGRKTSTDGFPGSAVVPRAKKINAEIVVPVIIEGRIGGGDIEMRCLQGADPRTRRSPGVRGKSGNPCGYVRPGAAAVTADVQVPVVRARPEHSGPQRRCGNGGDRGSLAGVATGPALGQIGADRRPALASVVRLQEHLSAEVKR